MIVRALFMVGAERWESSEVRAQGTASFEARGGEVLGGTHLLFYP